MPDRRRHRGPHPDDGELFGQDTLCVLRVATFELSWLLERGYSQAAALKLVGDRHSLRSRQRSAIRRSACTSEERAARRRKRLGVDMLRERVVALDGFNCVIGLEAALSGAPVFVGRDGVYRDLSSVHGSYRKVMETRRAVELLIELLATAGARSAEWYLDRPVSNSGRLKQVILEATGAAAFACTVDLVNDPDKHLLALSDVVVASGDSMILDGCNEWIDLPAEVLRDEEGVWLVDLSSASGD